jgi:hypothetical protein
VSTGVVEKLSIRALAHGGLDLEVPVISARGYITHLTIIESRLTKSFYPTQSEMLVRQNI